ncbi:MULTISPECIES: LuxR C-terminal-related transcriptional regulator [Pseudomonas]|uniref:DNA-binding response regulator n=1 Tax=Pseudomonas entomophila TaxID=312306 RepID=A0A3S8UEL3_9PSED|nr:MULTISPECIES: LuxR C-terminal-related transcriptional regulator [Pseudomonas]AZL66751.1 DNA-binding response regulator [Pseudomonas oryziphila]UVL91861.1 LuxR C-terminal-related transcriptional regulator [Pseudomonas sichuanensis]
MNLTPRESEVLRLLLLGKTNKQIAIDLHISDYTVRDHVSSLLRKHCTHSRSTLMAAHLSGHHDTCRI